MTNKEKYPNAEVRSLNVSYYISLDGGNYYLVNGQPNLCALGGYFKTQKEAQTALDNFMNGPKQEITLSEIKSQLEEAKKLVGKTVKHKDGSKGVVEQVSLCVDKDSAKKSSSSVYCFYEKYGYAIIVRYFDKTFPSVSCHSELEQFRTVSVTAHDGQTYTAESDGDCWKFGCARINKSLIKEAYDLFDKTYGGNLKVEKITIGKCDFDRETLKSLVELENS